MRRLKPIGPWDMESLSRRPPIEWLETEHVVCPLFYEGEPYGGKPTRVFAYYAAPKTADRNHKAPGMVLVHGGGGKAFPEWAGMWEQRGYAALAMDLSGRGTDGERLRDGGPEQDEEQKFRAIASGVRETWPYHAVAAVIRGISALAAQPEVDPERIGITGISWGGYLTCIVAGLDARLKLAAPVYGCGFLHENSAWVPILQQLPENDRALWIETFDPSHYIARARLPMLWVNGTNDFAYPLDSYHKSYTAQPGPCTRCVTVGMGHSHEHGWAPAEIGMFADQHLREGTPLAELSALKVRRGGVFAKVDSAVPIVEAGLHYTTDTGPWPERTWQSLPAEVDGRRVRAALPEARPIAFFLTVKDERGATVSTEHCEIAT